MKKHDCFLKFLFGFSSIIFAAQSAAQGVRAENMQLAKDLPSFTDFQGVDKKSSQTIKLTSEDSVSREELQNKATKNTARLNSSDEYNPKGWGHVYNLLLQSGIPKSTLDKVFLDERMPKRSDIFFSLSPKESRYPYTKLINKKSIKNALAFYEAHRSTFLLSQKKFGVPFSVVLAILQVETFCGKNTGNRSVLSGLARLVSANSPENLSSYVEKEKNNPKLDYNKLYARAQWLENTFFPHLVAVFKIAKQLEVHPLDVRGSGAGALGLAQFLPGNFKTYGVDANGDKVVDPYDPKDSILSISNFLHKNGWNKPNLTPTQKRKVIWSYNRSTPYIDTVLNMASQLEKATKK